MLQVHEQEPSPIQFTQTCEICYSKYELGSIHSLRPQGICYNCWYQHIKTVITQISYRAGSEIISPFEGKDPIDVCIALKSLGREQEAELQEFLFKKYTSFTSDIEKCPSESCDYVFTLEKCKWGAREDQKCPKCEAVLLHSSSFDIKTVVGFVYFLFLTNKCPKCEIPIEKTTGCPHMSCPCGHQFCWYCLKDYYPSANNIYSVHEPKECASIFISKIVFTSTCVSGIFLTLLGNQVFQRLMGYFYIGIAYLFHTLMLDLIIAINILFINNLIVRYQNKYPHPYGRNQHQKLLICGLALLDLVALLVLYYFDMLLESAVIMLVELSVIGVGALTIWLIVFSYDTWFKYIC